MAELALLGLVANIFQFVEQGIKIASTARDVYQCVDSFQSTDIRLLLEDIRNTSEEVGRINGQLLVDFSHDELAIRSYSAECDSVASELSSLAAKLTRKDRAKSRALDSVRVAYHSVTKKNEIQELLSKLKDLDERLRRRLERILDKKAAMDRKVQFSSIMAIVDRLDNRGFDLEVSTGEMLGSSRELLKRQLAAEHRVSDLVKQLASDIQMTINQQAILESLLFRDIKQRYSDIQDAHVETFSWVFESSYTNFPLWLQRGSAIYWISGLAGSGKSTLIKFVYDHPKTRELLNVWTGDSKLVTAVFCFWAIGTPMQKSQLGLLQSLMFQILRADSTLATALFPNNRFREPWTVSELRAAFRLIPELISGRIKFCFFIDGLDEYQGNEADIIEILGDISSSPSIKICVSSRPWNRFREAYSSCPSIAVERLTKTDIFNYINAELLMSNAFQESLSADPRCGTIISQLALQARGVFLWVFLVVRSLKRDLKSREPYEHLQQRIDEMPQSLEDYFRRIFDRIDTIYRQQTARLFLIALHLEEHNEDAFPLVAYNCIETEVRDPRYAVDQPLIAQDPSWISRIPDYLAERQKIAKTRLNDRCKDLLQPRTNDSWHRGSIHHIHISLLHRTVRDFLRDNYLESLKDKAGEKFSPEDSIAKSFLWLFKTFPTRLCFAPATKDQMTDMTVERRSRMVLLQFWTHATNNESHIGDETIESFFETMNSLHETDWIDLIVHGGASRYLKYPSHLIMIVWAVFLNLTSYVQRNWKTGSAEGHFDYEILTLLIALQPRFLNGSDNIKAKRVIPITPSTISALCELGCNPNDLEIGKKFLDGIRRCFNFETRALIEHSYEAYISKENMLAVTKILFQHGLRVPLTPREESGICKANFSYLFVPIFGISGVTELQRIRKEFQSHSTWTDRLFSGFGFL